MSEPKCWCTVCPLLNLDVGLKIPVYFARGLWLTLIPDWLRQNGWAELLNFSDLEILKQLQYAFVVEYEAASSSAPDPEWNGPEPRTVQDAKHELAMLANLAVWIVKPSPVAYELVFHAPRWEDRWNIQNIEKYARIRCHPKDRYNVLTNHDLDRAISLHEALCALPCRNSIWTAVHSTWAALQARNLEVRNLLLWTALDALFGPEEEREGVGRMARGIGAFVSTTRSEARDATRKAEDSLCFRRRLAHGQWSGQAELYDFGYDTEVLLREALDRVLRDGSLTARFCDGRGRESFLEELLLEKAGE